MPISLPTWRPRGQAASSAEALRPSALAAKVRGLSAKERAPLPQEQEFSPSPQQADFLRWITAGEGNCVLEAVAGAGKTTTLIQALLKMKGSVFFGAYNKRISDEIAAKTSALRHLEASVQVSTMHSIGYKACLRAWGQDAGFNINTYVDDRKVANILESMQVPFARACIARAVSLAKQHLFGAEGGPAVTDARAWAELFYHHSLEHDLPEGVELKHVLPYVEKALAWSREMCPRLLDFDDMLYAPLAHGLRMRSYDWVLIDECQDLNPARLRMARKLLAPTGRAVFVGDSRQAIYGFTGAGSNSIQEITKEFGATRMPLTVTYRCPKAVVAYVRQWVSHIEAHPSAPEGVVRSLKEQEARNCPTCNGSGKTTQKPASIWDAPPPCPACKGKGILEGAPWFASEALTSTDAILCRYVRPLVETAYALLREGVGCRIEGKDIGKGLLALVGRWKLKTIPRFLEKLAQWEEKEVAKANAQKSVTLADSIQDRCATLRVLADRCLKNQRSALTDLRFEIEELFADNVRGVVVLSTGHKAKGREWPRVFWLQVAARGTPSLEWERVQEDNVCYVIGTRAMNELVLVQSAL